MRNQRPGEQIHSGMTIQEVLEVEELLNKALADYRAELEYEFGCFLDFPTDRNQEALQGMLVRYRHQWMRAHDQLDEVEERGEGGD